LSSKKLLDSDLESSTQNTRVTCHSPTKAELVAEADKAGISE